MDSCRLVCLLSLTFLITAGCGLLSALQEQKTMLDSQESVTKLQVLFEGGGCGALQVDEHGNELPCDVEVSPPSPWPSVSVFIRAQGQPCGEAIEGITDDQGEFAVELTPGDYEVGVLGCTANVMRFTVEPEVSTNITVLVSMFPP